jgi:hypothetical protein
VNHEQLVTGAAHPLQSEPDPLDAARLTQIDIHDQHAMRSDLGVAFAKQPGNHFMPRLEHGADRGQLRRFIRYEVDEHGQVPSSVLNGVSGK